MSTLQSKRQARRAEIPIKASFGSVIEALSDQTATSVIRMDKKMEHSDLFSTREILMATTSFTGNTRAPHASIQQAL